MQQLRLAHLSTPSPITRAPKLPNFINKVAGIDIRRKVPSQNMLLLPHEISHIPRPLAPVPRRTVPCVTIVLQNPNGARGVRELGFERALLCMCQLCTKELGLGYSTFSSSA